MAQEHRIDTPRGSVIQTGRTTCRLEWSSNFSRGKSNDFSRKQKIVDSEALRYCSPLVLSGRACWRSPGSWGRWSGAAR